jgi:hypothetical protein
MILACLAAADLLSHLETWKIAGPLLLFLGFLTLLNAPFDWASLGLTRAIPPQPFQGVATWRPRLWPMKPTLKAAQPALSARHDAKPEHVPFLGATRPLP